MKTTSPTIRNWRVTNRTTIDQKAAMAEQLTALAEGKVTVTYNASGFLTYDNSDREIPGSRGHVWELDVIDWNNQPWINDAPGGDVRLLMADALAEHAQRFLDVASKLRTLAGKAVKP